MPVMPNDSMFMTAALCLGTLVLLATAGPQLRDALRTGKAVTGFGVFTRKKEPGKYWSLVLVLGSVLLLMIAACIVNILRLKSPF